MDARIANDKSRQSDDNNQSGEQPDMLRFRDQNDVRSDRQRKKSPKVD